MKKIALSGGKGKGKFLLVDDGNYPTFKNYKINLSGGGYPCYKVEGKQTKIHKQILKSPKGLVVDHINGNKLDNRKCNLRICTPAQNIMNQKKQIRTKSSIYKGVYWCKTHKKWTTKIKLSGRQRNIYRSIDEHIAGLMYDFWALELFGEFAKTNFPVVRHNFF